MKTSFLRRLVAVLTLTLAAMSRLALGADINPVLVGSWPGFLTGPATTVGVVGHHVYVGAGEGLQVFDFSTSSAPKRVGNCELRAFINVATISGGFLFAGVSRDTWSELSIVDISDPTHPKRVAGYPNEAVGFTAIAVAGTRAFIGKHQPARVEVLDISNPAEPRRVSMIQVTPNDQVAPTDLALHGNHLIIATESVPAGGLLLFDVSDPSNPRKVGAAALYGSKLAVSGDHVYLVGDGVQVIDISDSTTPRIVATVSNLDLSVSAEAVTVSGNRAYVVGHGGDLNGLRIIDVSNPTNPRIQGFTPSLGHWHNKAVAVASDIAFVADGEAGLQVIDVSDAANPRQVGRHGTVHDFYAVAVSGRHAYVAAGSDGLRAFDVTSPANLQPVGEAPIRFGSFATDVVVSGEYAFVQRAICVGCLLLPNVPDGFEIFNISDPANPLRVASHDQPVSLGAVEGSYAYVMVDETSDGLEPGIEILDISGPTTLRQVGRFTSNTPKAVAVAGRRLYIAKHSGMLEVVDISDPAHPRLEAACEAAQILWGKGGVAISGQYAYVIGSPFGGGGGVILSVIDISDPSNPRPVSNSKVGDSVLYGSRPIIVSDHYAYLAGLGVFDISNPAAPGLVAYLRGWGEAVSGKYTYVAGTGLSVYDVFNPAIAQRRSTFATSPGQAFSVAVSGNHAFVAAWQGGLQVIDITESSRPRLVARYTESAFPSFLPYDVAVSSNYAYVVNSQEIQVLDVSVPANPRKVGAHVLTDASAWALAVSGDHLALMTAVVDQATHTVEGRLEVIDVSDSAKLRPAGASVLGRVQWPFPERPAGSVIASGHDVYVIVSGGNGNRLLIFDVSDPTAPRRVGDYDAGPSWDAAASSNHIFLTGGGALEVVDVSAPAQPRRVGRYPSGASRVGVAGKHAILTYSGYGQSGLDVIDVSNPNRLRWLGGNSLAPSAEDVVVSQGRIFLAAGYEGLAILELQPLIKSIAKEGPNVKLEWESFGTARLQRATRLTNPDWLDAPGFEGTNTATLPASQASDFFRLVRP